MQLSHYSGNGVVERTSGNEIDQRSALDNRGILRDGCTMRVPLQIRDTARHETERRQTPPRITDGSNNPFALNKPGFRVRAGDTRQMVADAYQDYEDALVNAYRCGGEERDGSEDFGNASTNRESLPRRHADSQMMQEHRARMNKLYADRDRELSEIWRQP
jgi:hypothetical protein